MSGIDLIAAERQRQIDAEGYTPEHDASHIGAGLVAAAQCYLNRPREVMRTPATWYDEHGDRVRGVVDTRTPAGWPWSVADWKPTPGDRVRELVKAGALIAAEIDRLSRG